MYLVVFANIFQIQTKYHQIKFTKFLYSNINMYLDSTLIVVVRY